MTTGEWIQISVGVVLTLTLLAVCWYAWEARKQAKASARMAEEMRRQRLSVSQPVVVVRILRVDELPSRHTVRLRATNAGNGPAIRVRRTVSHPSLRVSNGAKEHTQEWSVLLANEEQDMTFVLSDPVEVAGGMLRVEWLDIHGQQFSLSASLKTERSGDIELGELTFSVGELDEPVQPVTSE